MTEDEARALIIMMGLYHQPMEAARKLLTPTEFIQFMNRRPESFINMRQWVSDHREALVTLIAARSNHDSR